MASVLLLHSLQRGRWRRVPGMSSFCGLHECRSMSHKQELPSTVAVRCSSSSTVKAMTPQPQGRLAKALYRQLLRWCQGIGYDVPLSTFIPPITLHAPTNVDGTMLLALATKNEAIPFPTNTIITPTLLTVPIHTVMDAKLFFQAIYRINCHQQQYQKERVTWAFQAIKSLNELTEPIEKLTEQRAVHMNRDDVEFHVGQVVQHNSDRWRGVVVGWERRDDTKPSSLTSKKYTNTNQIQYTMLLDSGDMHLIRRDGVDRPMANQSELTLVQDASLCRIHSAWIPQDFDRFDVTTKSFVPNPTLAYIYPCDGIAADLVAHNKRQDRANELGRIFIGSIQDFASRLERCVLDITSSANSRKLSLLASYEERILALSSGDVVSNEDKLSPRKMTDHALATLHLRRLLAITLELPELLFRRRLAQSNPVQFKLGDIVVHTKYGFRGVVVAWDPKPMVDVSRWDGLTHIENPNELPFYHILPDQTDCIKVFGGERQFRYVCEKNLEPCPRSRTNLNVEMIEDGWEENKKDARYNAPDEAKFKYGEDLGDDGVTEECFKLIRKEITALHVMLRDASASTPLSQHNLLEFLHYSDSLESAIVLEDTVKEIWKAHEDETMRQRLDDGILDLLRGKRERALTAFLGIVKDDPLYAEAWNKISTCQYMMGDMGASMDSATKALELLPTHFQALAGLGLIQCETRRYKLATESFRRSLYLDPWSPVSARQSVCLDVLRGIDQEERIWSKEEEQGAAEGTAPYH